MRPTLRQLQYLTLLEEHGSFSRAAEAAHVTQPTLSAGLQELERTLDVALVDHSRPSVILTAAGSEVAVRAAAILAQADELVECARRSGQPLSGRFRLGVIPTIAPFMLPSASPRLRERFPHLRLFLREDLTSRLLAELRAGRLDAALIALPYDTRGLETAPVRRDELRLALPAGHPLAARREIGPESLQADELILLEDGHCLTEHALTACRIGPGPGESGFSATSLTTLVQMVGGGLGISFLPAMAVEAGLAEAAGIAVRPLAMADASRQIVVAWRAGSRRAAEGRLLAEAFASLSRADEARAMGAANDRPVREDERPRQRLRRDRGGRRGPLGGPRAGAGGP